VNRGIALPIHKLGIEQRSTSRPGRCTHGKERWYSLNMKLGGPQSRYGRFWRREKSVGPCRDNGTNLEIRFILNILYIKVTGVATHTGVCYTNRLSVIYSNLNQCIGYKEL
jgi:hypothetical protein